ncbi:MAG TPA: ABC transporter permease subunit [Nitrososphaerales archaeon]|nr:ABC transporter permease subunit [Nitrososphaerales archaeon]
MKTRLLLPILVAVAFFIISVIPLFYLLHPPVPALGIQIVPSLFFAPSTIKVVETTLVVAVIELVLGFGIAFPYLWIVNKTDVPGGAMFDAVVLFGKTIPNFFKAIGWAILLAPRIGIINQLIHVAFPGFDLNIYTPFGLAVAMVFSALPVRYLLMSPAVKNLDPSHEEASRMAGRGVLSTFFRVTLPSLKQITLITMVLVFLGVMTDFDFPLVIAPSGNFQTLSIALYFEANQSPPDFGAAETLGIVLLIISAVTFAIYLYLTRKSFTFVTIRGVHSRRTVNKLRGWRWPAFVYCFAVFFMTFGFPLMGLLWYAFTGVGRLFTFVGLRNFTEAWNYPFLQQALINSILLGVLTVAITVPLSLVIAYGVFRTHFRGSRLLETAVMIPRSFPAVVYGLCLFLMFLLTPGLSLLYGTVWPFVFSNVIILAPGLIQTAAGNMVQISDELEEASYTSGSGWLRTFYRLVVPLNKYAIFNNGLSAFLDSIRELGGVVLLSTPSFYLFMTLLLDAYSSSGGNATSGGLNVLAAIVILVVIFLSAVTLVTKFVERKLWKGVGAT